MNEVWVPLVHEGIMNGYEISNLGHIRVKDCELPNVKIVKANKRNYVRLVNSDSNPNNFTLLDKASKNL
jgi:hypothetical protein